MSHIVLPPLLIHILVVVVLLLLFYCGPFLWTSGLEKIVRMIYTIKYIILIVYVTRIEAMHYLPIVKKSAVTMCSDKIFIR